MNKDKTASGCECSNKPRRSTGTTTRCGPGKTTRSSRSPTAPAQDAIKLLTGCGGNWDFKCGKGSLDNVTSWNDAIDAALKNNKVVVLETQSGNKNVKEGDPVEQDEGIVRGHEYVVIGYDSSSKMLKIRNPWGSGGEYQQGYSQKEIGGKKYWVWSDDPPDHKNDGTFTMSLDDAYRLFKNVTYEK